MASKTFTLNTEPHLAEIGEHKLYFLPEVYGDEFLDAYNRLVEAQKGLAGSDPSETSTDELRLMYQEMRTFLARLMADESARTFCRFEVVPLSGGEHLGPYLSREEADEAALEVAGGATVEDRSLRLPDRILVQIMEWVVELYGGKTGGDSRPTGSSSASPRPSSRAGTPGKGSSPSRVSTRAAGR